ncbi:bifunctional phosphoribosylaminoimidazolecarboxamide formyltransferase/IMP cyclohydrolase [Patescibacteria group bacterium]|nr:bifunctional phosphoribosylaminoimidazolecarboxamide formyltransferase/IMP cyclohydrolase [Patescibacteria group bacterium]
MKQKKVALISVSDKEGLIPFAKGLVDLDYELLSTGGTAAELKKAKIAVTEVSKYTKFPEIMDGRVKTLHPKIYGGILALRDNKVHIKQAKKHNIKLIDLVIINLYPFEATIAKDDVTEDEAIEQIDIGGPSMLRAAAKNYQHTTVITDKKDYSKVLKQLRENGEVKESLRRKLAIKIYERTYRYDRTIAEYLRGEKNQDELLDLHYVKVGSLRYGENPHQKAAFFNNPDNSDSNVTNAEVLQGKQLSFNNYIDADAALELVKDFSEPTAAVIKHTNPCGVASSKDIDKAFKLAYEADPLSAFGCVIALNRKCTEEIAKYISKNKLFVEIIAAPAFSKESLKIFSRRQNLRLLKVGKLKKDQFRRDIKKVAGGILVQSEDTHVVAAKDLKVVSKKKPKINEIEAMLFARNVVKHVKSNSVVFAKKLRDGSIVTTGIGAGQMSRVDAVFIARHKGGDSIKGSSLASDAFFPFADGVEQAYEAGATSIIQPGGSIRDDEVIKKVDELKISMVFTGIRSFKH